MDNINTAVIQEQQEIDGLISQARIEYGKVCVSQHELGITLLKLRDATKAQGSHTGKGFEACLADIGISKTQAYRFMKAAETGQPVDYDNETTPSENSHTAGEHGDEGERDFVPFGTKLPDGSIGGSFGFADGRRRVPLPPNAEPWQIEAATWFTQADALGLNLFDERGIGLPYGVVLTPGGMIIPDGLSRQQYLEIGAILRVLAPLPPDDRSEHQRKMDARRTRRVGREQAATGS